ncbi:unnamed protein product [Ophioblennius macclurei]
MNTLLQPTLFLLFGLHTAASVPGSIPKYEYEDPHTREILHCNRCPPGTHMVAHCTTTTQTECAPCASEYFTELWNYLPRCLYCHGFCTGNQEVERECSPTSDRLCRCKDGFYSADEFCIPHEECEPGHGVHTKGSSKMNTVCEKCSEGFYSASTSALDPCVKHEECASGQLTLLRGSVYHDTVCGSCEDLAKKDETLRMFLTGFLSKMGVRKIRRFVRHNQNSEMERCISDTSASKQRGPLLVQIREWIDNTSVEELRKMPQILTSYQLTPMAEQLKKRFSEIKELNPNCTLSF